MNAAELVNLVQAIAIAHHTWRGEDRALAELIVKATESETGVDEVRGLLHSRNLHSALISRQVALWFGSDGLARLVDQQGISNRAAMLKMDLYPGADVCRFCLMKDSIYDLETEHSVVGGLVEGSMVHPQCSHAWRRIRLQAEEPNDG